MEATAVGDPQRASAPVVHHRLRTAVLTGVVVQLAVLGHVLGGGMAPDLLPVLLAVALCWPVCRRSAATRRRFGPLLLTVAAAQPALHLLLSYAGPLLSGTAGRPAGHDHAVALPGAATTAGHQHGLLAMLVFHGVAALLTATVLALGEQAVVRASRGVRRVLARLLVRPVADVRHPAGPVLPAAAVVTGVLITRTRQRRGPPLLRAA